MSLGTLTAGIGNIKSKAAEGVQSKRSLSTDSASEFSLFFDNIASKPHTYGQPVHLMLQIASCRVLLRSSKGVSALWRPS